MWTLEGQEVNNELVEGDGERELKAMSWLTQRFPGSLGWLLTSDHTPGEISRDQSLAILSEQLATLSWILFPNASSSHLGYEPNSFL